MSNCIVRENSPYMHISLGKQYITVKEQRFMRRFPLVRRFSILCSPQHTKADNGCLGRFCRGRTYMAAIRAGEEPYSRDPAISEWSNPAVYNGQSTVNAVARLK